MSLINDALKKAQHQRKDDPAAAPATGAAGAARIPRRDRAHSANTMVLLGSGAVVIVVLSVVFTVFLVNQPEKSSPPAVKTTLAAGSPASSPVPSPTPDTVPPVEATPPAANPSAPLISVPIATAPADPPSALASAAPTRASRPPTTAPSPTPAVSLPPFAFAPTAASVPTTETPAPVALTFAPSASGPDERVSSFVEAVRVTGIRSFGHESRVLMNERVFRVNDIVERALGVRLTAVKADSLTFTDANGVTYVKNF